MRYDIKRWSTKEETFKLLDCDRFEVIKQIIKAIDNGQDFKAIISGPERDED